MKSRKRDFKRDIINHCYQRTVDGVVLFYSVTDFLVYFTIFSITASKYNVKVLSSCLMYDHLHHSLITKRVGELSAFMGDVTRNFSRVHNKVCHRKGALFESPFGSAPKKGDKAARANIIYVGNNPVERRICERAEEYRWNFLAYKDNLHPFSKPLVIRESSSKMKRAIKEVKLCNEAGKPLNYAQLQRMFTTLDRQEKEQLVDYIITTYNIIDYAAAARFFDSFEDMIAAMHSNTGSEYDLNEVFVGKCDKYYPQMSAIVSRYYHDVHDVLGLPEAEKMKVFELLRKETYAMSAQIYKFLRIPYKVVSNDL